ncbi:uncharacterized protein [Pseudorasbora parva]|uniref:uncharacterized protein n=1 Tax=Pseudorasbora parva TaxID=51549 RepID=UPI00351F0D4F
MTPHNDVEAFLQVFETTATMEGWPEGDWARALAPLLTGEAQQTYFSLPSTTAAQYAEVKREILARLGLSSICAAQQFHEWEYKPRLPARAQAAELTRLAHHWLLDGSPSAAQVAERVVIDRFLLWALPRSHRQVVGMRNPTTMLELVGAIELADAAQRGMVGRERHHFTGGWARSDTRRRASRDTKAGRRSLPHGMSPCRRSRQLLLLEPGWQAASCTMTFPLGPLKQM